jgi:hypothetical protein
VPGSIIVFKNLYLKNNLKIAYFILRVKIEGHKEVGIAEYLQAIISNHDIPIHEA